MKSLQQHIEEKLIINKNTQNIDDYFIYRLDKTESIKIFHNEWWGAFNEYKDKVYVDGKHVKLNYAGCTTQQYEPGIYKIEIKNIDNIVDYTNAMFNYCNQLISVPPFDFSKVKEAHYMFEECTNLESVPQFNMINVKTTEGMFAECNHLTTVSLLNTQTIRNMKQMFCHCEDLVDVPLFDINNDAIMDDMFLGCDRLSDETKRQWSQIYDFKEHKRK